VNAMRFITRVAETSARRLTGHNQSKERLPARIEPIPRPRNALIRTTFGK